MTEQKNENECRGTILVNGEIDRDLAGNVSVAIGAWTDRFEAEFVPIKDRVITLYIVDCPGGSVSAGMAILGAMDRARQFGVKFRTISAGLVASMAVVIAAYGDKGQRCALRYTEYLMHQPMGAASGQATDIVIAAQHISKLRSRLYRILAQCTGQSSERIAKDCDRDYIITADDAVIYGLCDEAYNSGAKKAKQDK
ncbi:MAG: ATP-dependent Clp protease proteolytic subunit [Clostridiales bacterium]|nr:ATP-dependent Clp protease proteolytic subunit [Clostridiales bacterium]